MSDKITIRCSELDRLLKCTHYLLLPRIERDTTYASAGRVQHQYAKDVLEGQKREVDSNTQDYIDYIKNVNQRFDAPCKVILEQTFMLNLSAKHNNSNYFYVLQGTPDAIIYCWKKKTIEIVDLKSGYQEVTPFTNQLKGYALLAKRKFPNAQKFILSIAQNNEVVSFNFDDTEYFLRDFKKKILNILKEGRYKLSKYCLWCSSKLHCLKMHNQAKQLIANPSREELTTHIKLLQNETNINKMLTETKEYLTINKPEYFIKKVRRVKVWVEGVDIPTIEKELSPTQALNIDKKYKENITETTKISYKIRPDI